MLKITAAALGGFVSLALPFAAQAVLPTGQLTFIQPAGTVRVDEAVEVWVRLTLDATSVPLDFGSHPLRGFDAGDLPQTGLYQDPATGAYVPGSFASHDGAFLGTYLACSNNSFTPACGGPDYDFAFWSGSAPGKPSIAGVDTFSLAPGASYDYLFGTFVPKAGGATPGVYSFGKTGLTLHFVGQTAGGHPITTRPGVELASTCTSAVPDCAFTRTVAAVPEPPTYGLMAVGIAGLAWRLRRR